MWFAEVDLGCPAFYFWPLLPCCMALGIFQFFLLSEKDNIYFTGGRV